MDAERFDRIVRLLPAASRRGAVRLLAAMAAGGAGLALLSPDEAAAKCVNPGKRCKKKGEPKQKCCGGAKCQGRKCKCPPNRIKCASKCCIPGQTCVNGACANGALAVGAACSKNLPGQCTSGKCGCNGNLCACRQADCKAPGVACPNGSLQCCNGVCNGGLCSGG